jgi:light-harvesting complex 1 beta chain
MADTTAGSQRQWSENASPASFVLFVVTFVVFLAVALAAQLLTLEWRAWFPGAEGEQSLVGGVKSAVYSVMSYII